MTRDSKAPNPVERRAQYYVQGDAMRETYKLSGLGVVGRVIAGELSWEPGDPDNRRLVLFESIDGPIVAELKQQRREHGGYEVFLVRDGEDDRLIRGWDLPEIDYESTGLVYYETRNGFARVLARTVPPGFWVRIADMPEGRLRPWTELLVESPRMYVGYDGHELHLEPSDDSQVLAILRDNRIHETQVHQLIPTGVSSGDWGEFAVIEFDGDFYDPLPRKPHPTGNGWKGWVRLVNEAGAPEFWFFTRGC